GRRVNGRRSRSHATARRAAIDAVAASRIIASRGRRLRAALALRRRVSQLDLARRVCGPACAGRASPKLSPALPPGQRRAQRAEPCGQPPLRLREPGERQYRNGSLSPRNPTDRRANGLALLGSHLLWPGWGYVDLNHGPLPYQGSALTD